MSSTASKHVFLVFLVVAVAVGCALPQRTNALSSSFPRDVVWCVAKNNADDESLQKALDWACGPGGANCDPIQPSRPCYDPSDLERTASWAFNDYYLKNGLTDDACYFSNTATLTSINPSHGNCKFPSSSSVNNGTATGMAPDNADISDCSQIADTRFLPLINTSLFVFLMWLMRLH